MAHMKRPASWWLRSLCGSRIFRHRVMPPPVASKIRAPMTFGPELGRRWVLVSTASLGRATPRRGGWASCCSRSIAFSNSAPWNVSTCLAAISQASVRIVSGSGGEMSGNCEADMPKRWRSWRCSVPERCDARPAAFHRPRRVMRIGNPNAISAVVAKVRLRRGGVPGRWNGGVGQDEASRHGSARERARLRRADRQ